MSARDTAFRQDEAPLQASWEAVVRAHRDHGRDSEEFRTAQRRHHELGALYRKAQQSSQASEPIDPEVRSFVDDARTAQRRTQQPTQRNLLG